MNREIKFRGLKVDGSGWVYGDLVTIEDRIRFGNSTFSRSFIAPRCDDLNIITLLNGSKLKSNVAMFQVIDETVGQFTGLKDMDGVEIWEGDKSESCEGSHFIAKAVKLKGKEFVWEKLNEFCMAVYGHRATGFTVFDDGRIVDESDEGNCGPMSEKENDEFAFFLKESVK